MTRLFIIPADRPKTGAPLVPAGQGVLPRRGLPPHRLRPHQHVVLGQRADQVSRLPDQLGTHAGDAHVPGPVRGDAQV